MRHCQITISEEYFFIPVAIRKSQIKLGKENWNWSVWYQWDNVSSLTPYLILSLAWPLKSLLFHILRFPSMLKIFPFFCPREFCSKNNKVLLMVPYTVFRTINNQVQVCPKEEKQNKHKAGSLGACEIWEFSINVGEI